MKKSILIVLVIVLLSVIIYCNLFNNNASGSDSLTAIEIYDVKVPEPSGLYFDNKTSTLWTVSDENGTIYNLDLEGNTLNTLKIDGYDLEGISFINDSILVTVLEQDRIVVLLDRSGKEIKRFGIEIKGKKNEGLEGVTYSVLDSTLYIVSEKKPGILLKTDLSGKILSKTELTFASDYSGVHYFDKDSTLYIISDEGKAIFKCGLDGTVLAKYRVKIKQIEGIAIDSKNSIMYLISDPLEKLFVFNLP